MISHSESRDGKLGFCLEVEPKKQWDQPRLELSGLIFLGEGQTFFVQQKWGGKHQHVLNHTNPN